jgi:hypothetical protein
MLAFILATAHRDSKARCVGSVVISGSVDVTFTSCGYWYQFGTRETDESPLVFEPDTQLVRRM